MSDLTDYGAGELAAMIRRRECSSAEVVASHFRRIARVNPQLNAVITSDNERACADARAADAALARGDAVGPLHGVPITVKDGFATAGLRTTFGLPWYGRRLDRYVPDEDAVSVTVLRRAGAIVLGKTNLPFGSYDWQTANPFFGRTNNPHDLTRTPGGSSGGSAAAVAAGLSPLDLASDVAGSIRVPAHFCGVYAMRPTEGKISTRGMTPPGHPGSLRHALVAGPVARSVADLRLALAVLTGEPAPNAGVTRHDLAATRVACSLSLADAPVAGDVADAVRTFAHALASAGCHLAEATPPVDFAAAERTWGLVHGFEFAAGFPFGWGSAPLNKLFRLGPVRLAFGRGRYAHALAGGLSAGPATYFRALAARDLLVGAFDDFFLTCDVWVCPVAGVTAFTHRRTGADLHVDGAAVPYSDPLSVFNTGTALAGTPCVVIPVGRDSNGLPVGVQIHARRGRDAYLLKVAEQMAKVTGYDSAPIPVVR